MVVSLRRVIVAAVVVPHWYDRLAAGRRPPGSGAPLNMRDIAGGTAAILGVAHCDGSIPSLSSSSDRWRHNFIADVAATAVPAVVRISCSQRGFERLGPFMAHHVDHSSGSGVLVSAEGTVLSNAHIASGCGCLTVELSDGRQFDADVIAINTELDLSLLQIRRSSQEAFPFLELVADPSETRLGDWVVAVGSPFALRNSVSVGIVSALGRDEIGGLKRPPQLKYIQTDAAINVGSSGGPLVNLDGKVVGINTITVFPAQGISFAIPSDVARHFCENAPRWLTVPDTLPHHGQPPVSPRRTIGVLAQPMEEYQVQALQKSNPAHFTGVTFALTLLEVRKNSPAEAAGLRVGDIITGLNGEKLASLQDILPIISDPCACQFTIFRNDATFTVSVSPSEV